MKSRLSPILLALLVGACGQGVESPRTSDPSTEHATTQTTIEMVDETRIQNQLIEAAVLARTTLAAELGVDEGQVKLVSADPVTWKDRSIGCPDRATSDEQELVEGYLVVFEHDGEQFQVHQAMDDRPIVCHNPLTDAFIPPTKKTPEIFIPPPIR